MGNILTTPHFKVGDKLEFRFQDQETPLQLVITNRVSLVDMESLQQYYMYDIELPQIKNKAIYRLPQELLDRGALV